MKPSEKRHYSMTKPPSSTTVSSTTKPSTLMTKDPPKSNIPFVPRHKKPVDVFHQANKILQKASSQQTPLKKQQLRPGSSNQRQFEAQRKNESIKQPQPAKQPDTSHVEIKQMLASYEAREKDLLEKVDRLQEEVFQMQKQHEKKSAALIKENKMNLKEIQRLNETIKNQEEQFNKLLNDNKIPYNSKREIILQSHIQKLKDYNKELTMRLKAFKGLDREQEAMGEIKINVMNEFAKKKEEDEETRKLTLESLAFRISKEIEGYMRRKVKKDMTFPEEQKYLVEVQRNLNQFAFECLAAGLSVSHEEICADPFSSPPLLQQVATCRTYPVLTAPTSRLMSNTLSNLTLITEANSLHASITPLLSTIPSHPSTLILSCFQSKKLPEIRQKLEQTLGVHLRMLRNTNHVYLSIMIHALGRYEVLRTYLAGLVQDVRKGVRSVAGSLGDLRELWEYKGKGGEEVWREKVIGFVGANLEKLVLKVGGLEKELEEMPVRFSQFVNYI